MKIKGPMVLGLVLGGAVVAALVLGLSDRGQGDRTAQRWAAQKAAADKIQLWSIEAKDDHGRMRQVRMCTDNLLRTGFIKPEPMVGDEPCVGSGDALVSIPKSHSFRCALGGRDWAVASSWSGDLDRDFTTEVSIEAIDPPHERFVQARHYRLAGPCPPGWAVGMASDRNGHVSLAVAEVKTLATATP